MPNTFSHNHRFADTLRRLVRRNAVPHLRKILNRTHPVDVAGVLEFFLPSERLKILSFSGDDERQAEIIASLAMNDAVDLLTEFPMDRTVALLREMSADDRADILGNVDEDFALKILAAMPDEESDEVEELMSYGESTAGGIMSPDFLAIDQETTARDAIGIVQDSPDVEMAFYIYIVNEHSSLVGVVSLRQLVTSKPDVFLSEIMNPHVVSVETDEDQEEVARIVSKYDFLAVPVVNDKNCLVGVVTVDDVIDVIREEATEDILKLAGAGDELEEKSAVLGSIKSRAPWLFAALIGGVVGAFVLQAYQTTMLGFPLLVFFIPVLIGMAGNVGTQSLTIVVRGLAMRRIDVKRYWRVIGREVLIGALLGAGYGALLGFVARFVGNNEQSVFMISAIIACSAAVAMTLAAFMATAIPLVFARLDIDPAVATGPFMTTSIDVVGVLVYLNMARALL